ncbi:MAG: hypothetical protein K8S23_10570 [Candidatus Cloacimonetes bacterium]|nr:hypothetical protein [Candidatus Cloacimonadota bacterium]
MLHKREKRNPVKDKLKISEMLLPCKLIIIRKSDLENYHKDDFTKRKYELMGYLKAKLDDVSNQDKIDGKEAKNNNLSVIIGNNDWFYVHNFMGFIEKYYNILPYFIHNDNFIGKYPLWDKTEINLFDLYWYQYNDLGFIDFLNLRSVSILNILIENFETQLLVIPKLVCEKEWIKNKYETETGITLGYSAKKETQIMTYEYVKGLLEYRDENIKYKSPTELMFQYPIKVGKDTYGKDCEEKIGSKATIHRWFEFNRHQITELYKKGKKLTTTQAFKELKLKDLGTLFKLIPDTITKVKRII